MRLNKNIEEWISFGGNHFNPKKLSYPITKKVIVSETKVIVSDSYKRHYTKEIVNKLTRRSLKTSHGNPDVNSVISYLKERLELPDLDLSMQTNRRYAWLLLGKSKKGIEGVRWLIDCAAADQWHKNHITSVRDLWNNQVKIVASRRGEVKKHEITKV